MTVVVLQTVQVPLTVIVLQTVEVPVTVVVEASPCPTHTPYPTYTQIPSVAPQRATPTATIMQVATTPMSNVMPTATETLPPGTTRVEKGLIDGLHAIAERYMPAGADSCELQYPSIYREVRFDGRQLVTIIYPLTFMWSEKSGLEDCTFSFQQTAPELFSFDPYLDEVWFMYKATVIDKYGAESMERMLKIHITRDQADKIVWANLPQCNIPLVVKHFSLHQSLSLRQAWSELCP